MAIPQPQLQQGRILRVFRDGRKHERANFAQLPPGAQGNIQTLAEMARIVREDAKERDIRNFVRRHIIGPGNKSQDAWVNAAYTFCRDKIEYQPEEPGYETIADLWSCLFYLNDDRPIGDCAIKIVALATMLAYVNLKPVFTAIQPNKNLDYFSHAYLTIPEMNLPLDPTPPQFRAGDEQPTHYKLHYRIF